MADRSAMEPRHEHMRMGRKRLIPPAWSRYWGSRMAVPPRHRALLCLAVALAASATDLRPACSRVLGVRFQRKIALGGPDRTEALPLVEALACVSRQTGLTLAVADNPVTRAASVQPGTATLEETLFELADSAGCGVQVGPGWVALAVRPNAISPDGIHSSLLGRWVDKWQGYQARFRRLEVGVAILECLASEHRRRALGSGEMLRMRDLSESERKAAGSILDAWAADQDCRPDLGNPDAALTWHWELSLGLSGEFGNYHALLTAPGCGATPPADEGRILESLKEICQRAAGRGDAPAGMVKLPQSADTHPSRYSLDEIVAAMRVQTSHEYYADRRIGGIRILIAGGERAIAVGALRDLVAAAVGTIWRAVGPTDLLIGDPEREGRGRIYRWVDDTAPLQQEFDAQFIRLSRRWAPTLLAAVDDDELKAGRFPYKRYGGVAQARVELATRTRSPEGSPPPQDLLARLGEGEFGAVDARLFLVLSIGAGQSRPVELVVSGWFDDLAASDRLSRPGTTGPGTGERQDETAVAR